VFCLTNGCMTSTLLFIRMFCLTNGSVILDDILGSYGSTPRATVA
jgi:hypothetical protein